MVSRESIGGEKAEDRSAGAGPQGATATAQAFARALLARAPETAAGYLALGAAILTPDGTEIFGRTRISEFLSQITSSEQGLEILLGRTLVAVDGSVALSTQFWRRRSSGSAGGFDDSTVTRLVLAWDGERWEIVIVSPWE